MTDVEMPDGTIVRASALSARMANDPDRDFGLYLDPAWMPDWPATTIDWPDFGTPTSSEQAMQAIIETFNLARAGSRVEVGCLGGRGRTGTVLACFAVLCGLEPEQAVDFVRSGYDPSAIETVEQERWVEWFAAHRGK